MKVLAVCATYFQLMVVLKLKSSLLTEDVISIVLTDSIKDNCTIAQKLREIRLFNEVMIITHQERLDGKKIILHKLFKTIGYKSKYRMLRSYDYDMIVCGNIFGYSEVFYNLCTVHNPKVYLIQDGNYNYCDYDIRRLIIPNIKEKLFHSILESLEGQYVFHSEFGVFIEEKFKSINIPGLNNQDKDLLNIVFGFDNKKKYNKKLLFIDQAFEELGVHMDEIKYVHMLENLVGSENIAIKLHPRTDAKKYIGVNCEIIEEGIPLELMILNNCDTEMLVSFSSSAGIMPSLCMGRNISSIFLYKLEKEKHELVVDYRSLDEMTANIAKKYSNIKAVNSMWELKEIIKKWN